MAEATRSRTVGLAPVLLAAAALLVVLLAIGLRTADPGAEELPPPIEAERPTDPDARNAPGDLLRSMYVISLGFLGLFVAVGLFILWRDGVKLRSLVTVWELLGFLLAVVFVVLVLLYWAEIRQGLQSAWTAVSGADEGASGGSGESTRSLPAGLDAGVGFLLIVLAVMTVYAVGFAVLFFRRLYGHATGEALELSAPFRREMARAVRVAIAELEAGGEFRDIVLRCYRTMVSLFEARGVVQRPSQTAREFEREALGSLGMSAEGVDGLTSLFEEARYSDHPIGAFQRDAAVACLTSVRRQLEGAG